LRREGRLLIRTAKERKGQEKKNRSSRGGNAHKVPLVQKAIRVAVLGKCMNKEKIHDYATKKKKARDKGSKKLLAVPG